MQTEYQNKAIKPESVKNKTLLQFHFAGGMEYQPLTIEAASYDEALKIWEKEKQPIKN